MIDLYSPVEYLRADAQRISESAAAVFRGLFIDRLTVVEVAERTGLDVDTVERWRGALIRRWRAKAEQAEQVTRDHAPTELSDDNSATPLRGGGRFHSPQEKEDGSHGSR